MNPYTFRQLNNFLAFSLVLILLTSCNSSEYDKTVRSEMDKEIQLDTLKFGLTFGDSLQEFLDKCTVLNKKQLITQGDVKHFAVHQIYDSTNTVYMKYYFFGKFLKSEDRMTGLDMQFSFNGWAPWVEKYQSDKLIHVVMDTLENWYPGNSFKRLDNKKLESPIYYKIDGNRQIILHTEGQRDVVGVIEDLNYKFK